MAETSPTTCRLLQLSPELLSIIAEYIPNQVDLRKFSNTCHTLHRIGEPVLYRNVTIESISSCEKFAAVVLKYPRRAWEVQSLKIYIPCYNEEPGDLDGAFVGYLGRLRDLNVRFPEMPKGVDKHDDVARTRRFLSLQSLRTCSLDLLQTDGLMWPLHTARILFQHRHLQTLTLHWVCSVDDPDICQDMPNRSTNLQELNILSSGITERKLATLLRLPGDLQCLTLGAPFNFPFSGYPPHDISTAKYLAAMSFVHDTLICLRLIQAPLLRLQWGRGPALGLEKFTKLRYLEANSRCLFEEPLFTPDGQISVRPLQLPPTLEVLKISTSGSIDLQLRSIIVGREIYAPALRRVILNTTVEEDLSGLTIAYHKKDIEVQVVHESAHFSFHGPPVWKIPGQML